MNYYKLISSMGSGGGASYGALTTAWITATGETDPTIIGALNTLETDLTTYGLTSKMKALYPMVGGTAAKHKFNFMDARDLDVAFRLTFSGGWTHSSTGALPNGTNAFANTFLNLSTQLSLNSTHLSYYSRTNSNGFEVEIGANTITVGGSLIEIRSANTNYFIINSPNTYTTSSETDSRGFFIGNRTASNVINLWKNSTKIATGTTASTNAPTHTVYLGCYNDNTTPSFYTTKQCSFSTIGSGLTDTDATNLYSAIQAFQTTLARNV